MIIIYKRQLKTCYLKRSNLELHFNFLSTVFSLKLKMKLILLFLITINTVSGGKCPPKEAILPCSCYQVI